MDLMNVGPFNVDLLNVELLIKALNQGWLIKCLCRLTKLSF